MQHVLKKIQNNEDISNYKYDNGILYYRTANDFNNRLVIPNDEDLKNSIIYEHHDVKTAGHPGYYKTYLAIQKSYYWPNMSKYIQRYVNTCEKCQRNKARQSKPPGLLQPLEIPTGRWCDITMDFLISLPLTEQGYDSIMVIIDRLTKRAKFIPTKTTASAEQTA